MAQAPNAAILSPLAFLLPLRSYCLFRRDRPKACDSYGRLAHTAGAQGCCAAVPGREPGVFDGSNLSAPDHALNGRTLETCRAPRRRGRAPPVGCLAGSVVRCHAETLLVRDSATGCPGRPPPKTAVTQRRCRAAGWRYWLLWRARRARRGPRVGRGARACRG